MSVWRRPLLGWAAGTAAALAAAVAARAQPAPQTLQIELPGDGVLTARGEQFPVKAMTYATFAETKRTSYSVSLPGRVVTFSGVEQTWSDRTHAFLTLDSVMSLAPGDLKDMTAAGTCQMEISEDATVVRRVACQATAEGGAYALQFQLGG